MIKTDGSPYQYYFDLINQQISDYSGRKSENIFVLNNESLVLEIVNFSAKTKKILTKDIKDEVVLFSNKSKDLEIINVKELLENHINYCYKTIIESEYPYLTLIQEHKIPIILCKALEIEIISFLENKDVELLEKKYKYGLLRYFEELDKKISNSNDLSSLESRKYFKIIVKTLQTLYITKKEILSFKSIIKIQDLEVLFYYFYDFNIAFHNFGGNIDISYLNKEIDIIGKYYSVFYELKEYRSTKKLINMHNEAIQELIKSNNFSFFKNRKIKKYIIQI